MRAYNMFYIETKSTDPYYNLAFEEYILRNKREGDWLLLWRNANTVVVGMNQNPLEEIDEGFVKAHGVDVVRRTTGGGAVYHDLGNVNYSFITDAGDAEQLSMERFTGTVCRALASMGVGAEPTGRNDITVQGKKISGTAQRLDGDRLLCHGTLLFKSDTDMIAGALRTDPDKYRSKSTKSVASRVGNISDYLPGETTVEDFIEKLLAALTEERFTRAELISREIEEVEHLAETKYRTWEWNYGASPPYDAVRKKARREGGTLEIYIKVEKGQIASVGFRGDFMARVPLRPLEAALAGRPFRRGEVAGLLGEFPIADMFGGITAEEILEVLFD